MIENRKPVRVQNGIVEVWTHADGQLRLTWLPDQGQPGYTGRTYSPMDSDLPPDFPSNWGMAELLEYGLRRWGER